MKRRIFLRSLAAAAAGAAAGAAGARPVRWSRARAGRGAARRILPLDPAATLRPGRWAG